MLFIFSTLPAYAYIITDAKGIARQERVYLYFTPGTGVTAAPLGDALTAKKQ